MLVINNLALEVTKNCNFQCEHCLIGDERNSSLNIDILSNIFTSDMVVLNLNLTGGETFTKPQLLEQILKYFEDNNIKVLRFSITTNGTLYTDRIEKILYDFACYAFKCQLKVYGTKVFDTMAVDISNDIYHKKELAKIKDYNISLYNQYMDSINKLMESDYFEGTRDEIKVINQGRAKNLDIPKYKPFKNLLYYLCEGDTIEASSIAFNSDGICKDLDNCDLKEQTLKDIIINRGVKCNNELEYSLYQLIEMKNRKLELETPVENDKQNKRVK